MADAPQSSNCHRTEKSEIDPLPQVCDPDFIVSQLPWVRKLAYGVHNHLPRFVPLEDLVSAGIIGLLHACRTFDKSKHVEFQCYARTRVRGAILDSLRQDDWAPRTLRRKSREVSTSYHRLSVSLGRQPSEIELADSLHISLLDMQELMRDLDALNISSLDETPAHSYAPPLCDRIAGPSSDIPYNKCLRAEIKTLLKNAISSMPQADRQVVLHYYFDNMTMKEVGSMLGVGESRVSQIHKRAIQELKRHLQERIEPRLDDDDPSTARARTPSTGLGDHEPDAASGISELYGE